MGQLEIFAVRFFAPVDSPRVFLVAQPSWDTGRREVAALTRPSLGLTPTWLNSDVAMSGLCQHHIGMLMLLFLHIC